jgi:hypothetical protein
VAPDRSGDCPDWTPFSSISPHHVVSDSVSDIADYIVGNHYHSSTTEIIRSQEKQQREVVIFINNVGVTVLYFSLNALAYDEKIRAATYFMDEQKTN